MSSAAIKTMMPVISTLKTLAAKAVLQQLMMWHKPGSGQIVSRSVYSLCRDLGVDKKTIGRAVAELEAAGILSRRPRSGDFYLWINLDQEPELGDTGAHEGGALRPLNGGCDAPPYNKKKDNHARAHLRLVDNS